MNKFACFIVISSTAVVGNVIAMECQRAPYVIDDGKQCQFHDLMSFEVYKADIPAFWDSWQEESPLLGDYLGNGAYYGFSLFEPKDVKELEGLSSDDLLRWLGQHGLTMSFGVGANSDESVRFRFDYTIHEEDYREVFLKVQVPIK